MERGVASHFVDQVPFRKAGSKKTPKKTKKNVGPKTNFKHILYHLQWRYRCADTSMETYDARFETSVFTFHEEGDHIFAEPLPKLAQNMKTLA